MENKTLSVECFENFILFKWEDKQEDCFELKTLRLCCPCAFCSGETDVFGNKYIGEKKGLSDSAFVL